MCLVALARSRRSGLDYTDACRPSHSNFRAFFVFACIIHTSVDVPCRGWSIYNESSRQPSMLDTDMGTTGEIGSLQKDLIFC